MSGVYQGAGRDCRYSGVRKGIVDIRGHWGIPKDVGGHFGVIRGCQWCIGAGRY